MPKLGNPVGGAKYKTAASIEAEKRTEEQVKRGREKKTYKIFEAFLGTQWMSWKADDRTKITMAGRIVTLVNTHEELGEVTTRFDLDQIPAYTLA